MGCVGTFILSAFRSISVEPAMVFFAVAGAISLFVSNNLLIQKACHPNLTSEPNYSLPCPNEEMAQHVIVEINTWRPILENVIPLFLIIFLGEWSDTHGKRRKPLVLIPLLGEMGKTVASLVCTYYWQVSPKATAAMESIIKGLTGGQHCFMFGVNTYVTDITTDEERTLRLGIVNTLAFVGLPIGMILGGHLRKYLGFLYTFALCLLLKFCALGTAALLMKNTACTESKLKTLEGTCDLTNFIKSVKTTFKKRPQNKRKIVLLMTLVAPLYVACFSGEFSVNYFFVRLKFNMDEVEYSKYCAFKLLTIFFGTSISLGICSRLLKMSDATIGCLGAATQIISCIGLCFAEYKWQLYLLPVIDLMHGAVSTASRSIITKNINDNELGQVFGFISSADVITPLIVFPIYNLIYKYTLNTLPGAFYLISVFLATITFVLFAAVYVIENRMNKEATKISKNLILKSEKGVDMALINATNS